MTIKRSKAGIARTHGLCLNKNPHPLYSTWCGMRQRCRDTNRKDSKHYSLKGVTVCERWQSFENFVADMAASWQPGLTLHRVKGDKGYEPGNVVWADWNRQNAESSHARIVEIGGVKKTLSEWGKACGGGVGLVFNRLRYGWPVEDACTTPKGSIRKFGRASE